MNIRGVMVTYEIFGIYYDTEFHISKFSLSSNTSEIKRFILTQKHKFFNRFQRF